MSKHSATPTLPAAFCSQTHLPGGTFKCERWESLLILEQNMKNNDPFLGKLERCIGVM